MKKFLFSLILVLAFHFSYSQLNGSYAIGGSSSIYPTISAAVSALNSNGINGNVIFNIAPGNYAETFTVNNFTGSTNYTVTFKSANGDSTSVTVSSPSSTNSTDNYTIKLNGAKNIVFQGITIERSGTNDYASVVELANSTQNLKFKNCIIKNQLSSSGNDYASLLIGKNLSSTLTDLEVSGCKFVNGSYGVYFQGASSTNLANNLLLSKNIFENQARSAIYAAYQNSPVFIGNIITSAQPTTIFRAIDLLYCNNQTVIKNNKINIALGTAFYLLTSQGSGANKTSIFNNFITVAGGASYGIYLSGSGAINIYFNSIYLNGASTTGFYVNGTSSNNINFANNIIYNPGGGKLMQVGTNTNSPFTYLNYNDYFTSGNYFGDWKSTTNISSFGGWKTACSNDATSLNLNPGFVSSTDLHIQGSALQRKGSSAITTPYPLEDVDGNTRHFSKPDIGAHELSYDDLKLSSLVYNPNSCLGQNKALKIYLKNVGNSPITENMTAKYNFNNTVKSETVSLNSLMPGDSVAYTFTNLLNNSSAGNFTIKTWFELQGDINSNNDSASLSTVVTAINPLSLPNDTLLCANLSLTLDAGAGYDSYLWSNGQTTQQVIIDTTQAGLNAKFFSVTVTKSVCSQKDSTLVWFKLCTGIEDIMGISNIIAYPNPVKNTLFLSGLNNIANFHVQIFSLEGTLVYTGIYQQGAIDIAFLPSGIYLLALRQNDEVKYLKFNKE